MLGPRPAAWEFERWNDRDSGVIVLRFGNPTEPLINATSSITVYSHAHKLVAVQRRWIEAGPKEALLDGEAHTMEIGRQINVAGVIAGVNGELARVDDDERMYLDPFAGRLVPFPVAADQF